MALLGAQLVITLIMVSVIQKLSSHYSFAKWLLSSTGLVRFIPPSNDYLRTAAGIPKEKTKSKAHVEKSRCFHVPRNLEVDLESVKVSPFDIMQLRYFTEYQWLVDFTLYASLVYIISEGYHNYFPLKEEVNLSMVWCILVVFFALKLLGSLTVLYFKSQESVAERSMCIVACLTYLLIAMVLLIVDDNILETGLDKAYSSFNKSASAFLLEQGVATSGPISKIVLKFFIAFSCGLLGSLFTFPGLRMARMHWDALKYCKQRKLMVVLLNVSFILPFILIILWIRPISRDYLTVHVLGGMEEPLLTSHSFEAVRLIMVVTIVILRFALLPTYLQSYLNIAHERIQSLQKEGGRITNLEIQQKVSSIFSYLCVVTLQFTAPLIMCLHLTLMYKSLSGFTWFESADTSSIVKTNVMNDTIDQFLSQDGSREFKTTEEFQTPWQSLRKVFSTEVYNGFLGFASWWSYFTLFSTSALGMLYQSYFAKS